MSQVPVVERSEHDDGLVFAHSQAADIRVDLLEYGSMTLAVAEELVAKGVLDMRSIIVRKQRLYDVELARLESRALLTRTSSIEDKYQCATPDIPCEELLPICRAACCSLTFYLSHQDLDEGTVRWDYKRPYFIRRKADGTCFHLDGAKCSVYECRPGVCRSFDCRNDSRIWKDYEKRIPAAPAAPVP